MIDKKQLILINDNILTVKYVLFDYVPVESSLVIFLDYKTMVVNTQFEVITIDDSNYEKFKFILYGIVEPNSSGVMELITYHNVDQFKNYIMGKKLLSWQNMTDSHVLQQINSSEVIELHYKESTS